MRDRTKTRNVSVSAPSEGHGRCQQRVEQCDVLSPYGRGAPETAPPASVKVSSKFAPTLLARQRVLREEVMSSRTGGRGSKERTILSRRVVAPSSSCLFGGLAITICTIPYHTVEGTCARSTSRSTLLTSSNAFLPSVPPAIFPIRCSVEVDSDCVTICEE